MSRKTACRTCEICGIKEAHLDKPLFFANFPLDENRCRKWVQATGKEDLIHVPIEKLHTIRHICGKHFKSKDFNKKGNKLKKRAIPCLDLKTSPLSDDQMSSFPLHILKNVQVTPPENMPSTSKDRQGHEENIPTYCHSETASGSGVSIFESTSKEAQEYEATTTIYSDNEASTSCARELITKPPEKPSMQTSKLVKAKGVKRKSRETEELTPRKKKLVEKLAQTKCTLNSLRKSAILIEQIESPALKELVTNSCKNEKRKPKGRRWTTKHKLSCLAILKRSPKAYRYLSAALTLPSVKTLHNILRKIPMQTGINQSILNHLKVISEDMDEKDKICSLVFDEMAIKSRLIYNEVNDKVEGFEDIGEFGRTSELANHALVFMLQGLRKKFKQPIAFYFTKGTISSAKLAMIIKNIIKEVTACGFTILNTVCDQGPTNMGALKILREASGPSEEGSNHYFKVEGEKVFIIYDIPHLFKSIRNNFMKAGNIIINNKQGKWEHLVEMETHNRNFIYLNKITELHVNPKYKSKMRVKLAAQLLSNTVAAVLKLLSRAEREDKANDLLSTAQIVEELDQLFDLTNGPSSPQDIKKNKRENVSMKTNHLDKWAHAINMLSKTKFINRDGRESKNVKCIEGYIISLKSLRDIWLTVKSLGYKYLNLRNLNQDALENLFGLIRQHSPTNRNPTAAHFTSALKTAVVTGLTAPHSRSANCEKDNKKLLTNFHDFVFDSEKPDDCIQEVLTEEKENIEIGCTEFPVLEIPEIDEDEVIENDFTLLNDQPIVYVAGYLAKQILKNNDCVRCKNNITVLNPADNPMYTYIYLREWWQDKFSLTYPSINFCKVIQKLIVMTEKELLSHLHEPNVCLLGCTLYTDGDPNVCFGCPTHGNDLAKLCFKKTCKLLIRRQCQRVNQSLASKEEDISNLNKKAEQLEKAK